VRLLVGLHHLELGGSQLNALDLAMTMRDRGHDVAIFGVQHGAEPGPVAGMARDAGLPVTLVRHPLERTQRVLPYRRSVARALVRAVQEHNVELVHVYEYPLILDAFHGPHVRLGTAMTATIYAMAVPTWLPRYPELILGSQELVSRAETFRNAPTLIEPPVNTRNDSVNAVDGAKFRAEYGIADHELALVIVSRLEPDMKGEGIERTIDAIRALRDSRLRLIIVGAGPSSDDMRARAADVNAEQGREAITLTGALSDPRPAYAAADIALGMGGSALRALSFGKPLIVLGTGGFSAACTPQTLPHFLHVGFFGEAPEPTAGTLVDQIRSLAVDADARAELGAWGRRIVVDRFSLDAAADKLADVYAHALANQTGTGRRVGEAVRAASHRAAAEIVPVSVKKQIKRVLK
jgi:glycosyltransferase involved in cell wall biosynthesis